MARNRISLRCFPYMATILLLPFSVAARESKESEAALVFAVFATKRSRADLLEQANALQIRAYNVNAESEVDLENKCIKNVWVREKGKWLRAEEVLLPDVVYDFGVYKHDKKRKIKANSLKDQLRSYGIPFINPEDAMEAVNNKVLFARVMREHDIAHPYTLKYKKANLNKMLDKYDSLFLKPTFGSKGQGIVIVQKIAGTKPRRYSITYKKRKWERWIPVHVRGIKKGNVNSEIKKALKKLRTEHAPYLVQQGITYFRFDGQQTDFRVNTQRGQNGELVMSGMAMRVGGNLSQGGRPADPREVLKPLLEKTGLSIETIEMRVTNMALKTHEALEKFGGKLIGDLGLDLVITDSGEPYIIEANNKNGYLHRFIKVNPEVEKLFDLPPCFHLCKEMDDAHEENLIEYARHLNDAKKE